MRLNAYDLEGLAHQLRALEKLNLDFAGDIMYHDKPFKVERKRAVDQRDQDEWFVVFPDE